MVLYEVARRGWMKQISGSAPAPRLVRPQLPAPAAVPAAAAAEAPEGADALLNTDLITDLDDQDEILDQ
jgi:23S rRNA (guanosine2251-2'-O)-methyltransferase